MSNLELHHNAAWLSREELDFAREKLPILYVDAVPVRVDDRGAVTAVGVLLRLGSDGSVCRELVSGRVLHHERVRGDPADGDQVAGRHGRTVRG